MTTTVDTAGRPLVIAGGTFAEPSKLMFIEFVNDRWLPSRELQLKPATINDVQR